MADVTNPIITPISPIPNSKNNPIDSLIIVQLSDQLGDGTGIDTSTLDITVGGEYVFNNGVLQSGFDGYYFNNPDGYNLQVQFTRTIPYLALQSVNISVSCRDLASNPASTSVYSFITLDNVAPSITEITPEDKTSQVSSSQPISFRLRTTPYETDIDINTLVVTISGLAVDGYGDLILDGYGNPIEEDFVRPDQLGQLVFDQRQVNIEEDLDGLGYSILITPLEPYPLASKVTLKISVEDLAGNLAESTTSFTTSDDQAPTLLNPLPAPNSISNSLLSAISFTLADQQGTFPGSGVNKQSINVTIDGQKAIESGLAQQGFIVDIIENPAANGFDVSIASDSLLPPRRTINVNVEVADNNFNVLTTNYVFTTEDIVAPEIIYVSPRANATTNIPQNAAIIVDVKSEVAVGEIDISSVAVLVDQTPAFINNVFQPGFSGLAIATTETTLTISLTKDDLFGLGQTVQLDAYASDIFGNQASNSLSFTTTTKTSLSSQAFPVPGIYDKTGTFTSFPPVGSFLDITLVSNLAGSQIAFTTDGSDPAVDSNFLPLGTTEIYSTPIRIVDGAVIRFFSFNSTTGEKESINNAVYAFSDCPEEEQWQDLALINGLEYTNVTQIKDLQLVNDLLTNQTNQKLGTANYVHDLGRVSFIDSLEFNTNGTTRFRVKVSETQQGLVSSPWCNLLDNFAENQFVDLIDGYGLKITSSANQFHVEGRSQLSDFFADEAFARINQPLFESFQLNAEMRLNADLDNIVGSKAFLRIIDDNQILEVQQYVSKVNSTANSQLIGESSLIGETPELYVDGYLIDGYPILADGYSMTIEIITPSQQVVELISPIESITEKIEQQIDLPEQTTDIFSVVSSTPSVYNQFVYSQDGYDGYTYSSALVKSVNYKRFENQLRTSFAIPVLNKPLDSTVAQLNSENLETINDKFIPAETNNIFETQIFLEPGDYNFRYSVIRSDERVVSNPYLFETKQDLSIVLPGDILIANNQSYQIASVVGLLDGSYAIEFEKDFPNSTQDIATWTINRNESTIITGSEIIFVSNPTLAELGEDSDGLVANLIINSRQQITFRYASSTATEVSVVATFNNFDRTQSQLVEQLDPTEIEKVFDGDSAIGYQNDYVNFHKLTITPELPLIVDRIRFTTGVQQDGYQRTRLLLDDLPVPSSNYQAFDGYGNLKQYLNNIDIYTSAEDGFVEWKYLQISNNLNRTQRESIGLLTRLDSLNQIQRNHLELEIFTIEKQPQIIADYFSPVDSSSLIRNDKSGFASIGNQTTITYGVPIELQQLPTVITSIEDDGLINNFLQSNIILIDNDQIYVEKPYLFNIDQKLILSDQVNTQRATAVEIDQEQGLIKLDQPVSISATTVVSDYQIAEDQNNFYAQIEIPDFVTLFSGTIRELNPQPGATEIIFENILNTDIASMQGGRLFYPLLESPAKILQASKTIESTESQTIDLIKVIIDQELTVSQSDLGAIIEVYNSTKTVIDYTISKTTGIVICNNQSLLSNGVNTKIDYQAIIPAFQSPTQALCFDGYDGYVRVEPKLNSITLQELDSVTIDFFNGVEAEAPSEVKFTINDQFSFTVPKQLASIVDGYDQGFYDPNFANTGQILKYQAPISLFNIDGYQDTFLTSLMAEFEGSDRYCIGEIEAVVDTSLVNSRCRIMLDQQELFLSDLEVNNNIFSKYQIHIDRGSLLVYFNGDCVLTRPILFTNPKIEFGASGKAIDDLVVADFRNMFIDQFYNISPGKIEKVGRYIQIEGTVLS